ncbi:MAG: hypothetical protein AAF741_07050 [Bacteroidota bacterium]
MLQLQELIDYVTPSSLNRISLFRNSGKGKNSLLSKLYQSLSNKEVQTDKEASEVLFGKAQDLRYAKLKYRLKQQLINTVLMVEPKEKSRGNYNEIFTNLRKQLCVADIMRRENKYSVVFDIVKKVFAQAQKAEMTSISLHCTQLMLSYYHFKKHDLAESKKYIELAKTFNKLNNAEVDAFTSYFEMIDCVLNTQIPTKEKVEIAETLLKKLDDKHKGVSTIDFDNHYYFIKISSKAYSKDYLAVMSICEDQIRKLEKKPFYPRAHVRNYLFQIMNASLPTRAYSSGKSAYERFLEEVDIGKRPWFRAKQFYIYLAIHSEDYSLAYDTCNSIIDHSKFKDQAEDIKERFLLLRAYLYWLDSINVIPEERKSFRLGKFLNEMPEFSKDRLRFNIPILVIQVLWIIHRKAYDKADERLTSLQRYADRYLKKIPDLSRTYHFLKAITKLRVARFNRTRFEERTSDFMKKLQENPSTANPDAIEIEIVPYDRLYTLLLDQLDNKLH